MTPVVCLPSVLGEAVVLPLHALLAWLALAGAPMTSPCVKPGVSRWSVKTSLPSRRAKPVPMSLAAITALPIPASVTGNTVTTRRGFTYTMWPQSEHARRSRSSPSTSPNRSEEPQRVQKLRLDAIQ